MKLSVLLSVYNSNIDILKKVITNVFKQTYKDFELIIVNDGSTHKELLEYLDSLQKTNLNIKLINNDKNEGLIYSLNKGIHYASGEYIARIDDDDIPSLDRFRLQVDFLDQNKEYFAVGGYANIVDEKGIVYSIKKYKTSYESIRKTAYFRSPISHSLVMYRRKELLDIGGYKPEYHLAEDYELWLRSLKYGYKLTNLPIVLGQQKFTESDISKRNKVCRKSALKAKVDNFDKKNFLHALLGVFFAVVWYLMPDKIIKIIYKKDIKKSFIFGN